MVLLDGDERCSVVLTFHRGLRSPDFPEIGQCFPTSIEEFQIRGTCLAAFLPTFPRFQEQFIEHPSLPEFLPFHEVAKLSEGLLICLLQHFANGGLGHTQLAGNGGLTHPSSG
jgi:hypothetical protein